jgi:hypothetical protein
MSIIEKAKISVGQGVKKREDLHAVGGIVHWYIIRENGMEAPQKN